MLCVPKPIAEKLRSAAAAGEIKVEELFNMTSKQRRELFSKFSDKGTAEFVNANFEKAMISSQKDALAKWAQQTFIGKPKRQTTVIDRINELDELGVLRPEKAEAFLEDLVASKLGVRVTPKEVEHITRLAKDIESKWKEAVGNEPNGTWKWNPDNPDSEKAIIEFFKAKEKMNEYIDSVSPKSVLQVILETIGPGNMLLSVKSPLTNIISNAENSLAEHIVRSVSEARLVGDNPDLAMKFWKLNRKIYYRSRYDLSRLIGLDDKFSAALKGEERRGSSGPGLIRKVGKWYDDYVFGIGQGAADMEFASAHWAHSADIVSTDIARREGLRGEARKARAAEILKDAASPTPKTKEGLAVREQAVADAHSAVYTDTSWASQLSLSLRKLIDTATGNVGVGRTVQPFVKTTANVIEAGLDAGGLGAVKAIYKLPNAMREIRNGNVRPLKAVFRDAARTGVGLTLAYAVATLINPDDYIGAYPTTPKEKALLDAKNATENSIRVGDKWISLDYLGPTGAPLVGILNAKKYGKNPGQKLGVYLGSMIQQLSRLPVLDSVVGDVKYIQDKIAQADGIDWSQIKGDTIDYMYDFVGSRGWPAFLSDIAKASDPYQRQTNYKKPITKLQTRVPGWRNQLPEKQTVTGEIKKAEPWWSSILFGSRLQTASHNRVTTELDRLAKKGQLPSIGRVENTGKFADMRSALGEQKFARATRELYDLMGKNMSEAIKSSSYRIADDEGKAKIIEDARTSAKNEILVKYQPNNPGVKGFVAQFRLKNQVAKDKLSDQLKEGLSTGNKQLAGQALAQLRKTRGNRSAAATLRAAKESVAKSRLTDDEAIIFDMSEAEVRALAKAKPALVPTIRRVLAIKNAL